MLRKLILTPLLLWLATALGAQIQGEQRISLTARFVPATAAPGQEVTLEVEAEIEPGYHVYGSQQTDGQAISLEVDKAGPLAAAGGPEIPGGTLHTALGIESFWVEGTAVLSQRYRVPADAAQGAVVVRGRVPYVACTPDYCEPPNEERS